MAVQPVREYPTEWALYETDEEEREREEPPRAQPGGPRAGYTTAPPQDEPEPAVQP